MGRAKLNLTLLFKATSKIWVCENPRSRALEISREVKSSVSAGLELSYKG